MSYSFKIRDRAVVLRKKGFSLNEISSKLNISKNTASLWLSAIILDKNAMLRLEKKRF